ncbi:MAG: sugar transferase [Chloroflexi bacterium]|nr:sugar transferase [Chloroflexota bacterium]MDA1148146.1 sugar transferase [Chloroflexota bacterium]PKB56445.1 MAG: hypothetical protein BZY69_01650 [SAR202 cluster bacterium Casp-Chloro-G1]
MQSDHSTALDSGPDAVAPIAGFDMSRLSAFCAATPAPTAHRGYRVIKRLLDLVAAVMLLVVLSPLMAVIAVAILLDSPGGVFFSQQRAGLRGRPFRLVKFRTMRRGAEDERLDVESLNMTMGPTPLLLQDEARRRER